jgi:hypothetical protein
MLNKKKIQLLSACFLLALGAIMFVGGLLAGERTIAGLGSHDWMMVGVLIYTIGSILVALYLYNKYHKR